MPIPITGFTYKIVIEPLLLSVHTRVLSLIETNQSVLDVACGTGALSLLIAGKAQQVIGIDKSSSMINIANKTKRKRAVKNIDFLQADATKSLPFKKNIFDIAVISMGLHQFQFTSGCMILQQMKRIAVEIIVLDYAAPLPDTWNGFIPRFFEILGGSEHNNNFRLFNINGGINSLIAKAGLKKNFEIITRNKIFMMVKCHK